MDEKSFEIEKMLLEEAEKRLKKEKIKKGIALVASYVVISFVFFAKDLDYNNTFGYIFNGVFLGAALCVGSYLINGFASNVFSSYEDTRSDYEFHSRQVFLVENKEREKAFEEMLKKCKEERDLKRK